jgi:hypothetical protein
MCTCSQYTTLVSTAAAPPAPSKGHIEQAAPRGPVPGVSCCAAGVGNYLWRAGGADSAGALRGYNTGSEGRLHDITYSSVSGLRYKAASDLERSLQGDLAATRKVLLQARSFLFKAARFAARTALVTSLASALAVFVACDFDDAKTLAAFVSVPRTIAAISWGVKAAGAYRRVMDEYAVRAVRLSGKSGVMCRCGSMGGVSAYAQVLAGFLGCRFLLSAFASVLGINGRLLELLTLRPSTWH